MAALHVRTQFITKALLNTASYESERPHKIPTLFKHLQIFGHQQQQQFTTDSKMTNQLRMEYNKTEKTGIKTEEAMVDLTVESLLETITQDYLKCHICLSTFTDPTFLDCHHTFCRSCLGDLRNSRGHSRAQLVCPDCRAVTSLGGRDMAGLKPNFTVASLIDDMGKNKKLLRIQQGAIICSLCQDEAIAAIQCADCDQRLCNDCWAEQGQSHDDHTLNILEKNEPGTVAPNCKKHKEHHYCLYCDTCKVLICAMCAATRHRGLEHEHVDIDEAENAAMEELSILLSKSEKRLHDFISQKQSIEEEHAIMKSEIDNAVATIEQDEEYAEAPDKDQVLEDLNEFRQAREEDFSTALDSVGAKVDWVQHVSDSARKRVAATDKYRLLQEIDELLISVTHTLAIEIPTPRFPKLEYIKVSPDRYFSGTDIDSSDSCYYSPTDERYEDQKLYRIQVRL